MIFALSNFQGTFSYDLTVFSRETRFASALTIRFITNSNSIIFASIAIESCYTYWIIRDFTEFSTERHFRTITTAK